VTSPDDIVIVGAAETDQLGTQPSMSALGLGVQSARNALADCGLSPRDVDGVAALNVPFGVGPVVLAHAMGIQPTWLDATSLGGGTFLMLVNHAAAAIRNGSCSVALVIHGESGRSRTGMPPRAPDPSSLEGQFENPYGTTSAATRFTLPALRYMHETGTTHEHLAEVAVAQRRWAQLNPRAMRREPLTVDDVMASRMIAYPFHLPECCLVADAGGALVVTTRARAEELRSSAPPVTLLGAAESMDTPMISAMEDFTTSRGFRVSSSAALRQAERSLDDIDHVMIYDAFAHLPLFGLEDVGFVKRGEAGDFIAEGHTSPGGRLPVNTNGGGLSYAHTGHYGMFAILESVRQLRGTAPAQVPGVRTSLVQGVGGYFMTSACLVLGNTEN
jgi:acetyl-CoA acetyltransferase